MQRWFPPKQFSEREERLFKLATRSRKLLVFLRAHRHELFDASFQEELEGMYRDTGQGQEPQPPALMCMAILLAGYQQTSDAEAVRLSAHDACWRAILGTLGDKGDAPAFSQGGLQQFRERLIRHDMDRRLLERSIELAKRTKDFDWKKLPKTLRVAVDSRPLGASPQIQRGRREPPVIGLAPPDSPSSWRTMSLAAVSSGRFEPQRREHPAAGQTGPLLERPRSESR